MSLSKNLGRSFVVTAELDPPRGPDPTSTLNEARALRGLVDAVNVSDSPMANLRMSPIAIAHLIQRDLSLEVIFHLTCRDRNVLGLQAELLGAHALGVRHILCLYGDPPTRGDHPEATGVYEVGADGLASMASELNAGRSKAGRELGSCTDFRIGVALNPTNPDLEREKERLQQKVSAGAHFAQTQPVFSTEQVERFMDAVGELPIPVLFGVLPIRSVKMAQNVSKWASVPAELLSAVEEGGAAAGVAWSAKLVEDLRGLGVAGVHLYPLGKPEIVGRVLGETPALTAG
ncbi:methylenetetrahydrofolate reductase [Deinococcus peraridilitoris]|uniref:Methylenetetrahydrofolate reductase n=1 Tax=Deinococcus peraridilitoris (strain DSM 19664 / LMG 22246 / CIP 109416 / KR-200) TaxID=937777 RepID=L0A584_DEIPD|nr:methylenetetrahydrofolate reductase [Deinococcus peraridilitoris]AFZ69031.1 5,10-methylenetetrahydrofolate reductase [Deinococcus peraridilitoris DSM 19664]